MFRFIVSIITTIGLFFSSFGALLDGVSTVKYSVDTSKLGDTIPNIVDNVNVWEMGTQFYNTENNDDYDIFNYVKYIQLMQCTGGNSTRDLFKDPTDKSVLDDYDFTRLIENCKGILKLGAKPFLKLGSVPEKFTTDAEFGEFDTNIYPPDDYNQYYTYIKHIALALVDAFGIDEVRTWRFGCMTEFENESWFMAKSKDKNDSMEEYCKLYDYTVQALIDVLGDDVFVGAHSMCVTEGLWKEEMFLKHCAKGTNYATGEKGSRICYISASFYDSTPGDYTNGYTLPELFAHLQKYAKRYGLNDLIYGIDEGRILCGNTSGASDKQLLSRTVGYTYQGAYDARLYKQAIDSGADYISSWGYLTDGLLYGYPTISYHIANNIYKFAGSKKAKVTSSKIKAGTGVESECLAGWDEETKTLRLMTYNYKNSTDYSKQMNVTITAKVPQLDGKTVKVTKYLVNDNCNFFDEWLDDREKYGITDDCFAWSPDDGEIDNTTVLNYGWARDLYMSELRDKYIECSKLVPVTQTVKVENGKITLNITLDGNNVVFYEISE